MKRGLTALLMAGAMAMPMYSAKAEEPVKVEVAATAPAAYTLPEPTYEANGDWTDSYATSIIDLIEVGARNHNPASTIRRIELPRGHELAIDHDNDGIYDVCATIGQYTHELIIDFSKKKIDAIPEVLYTLVKGDKVDSKLRATSDDGLKILTDSINKIYAQQNEIVSKK